MNATAKLLQSPTLKVYSQKRLEWKL